MFPSDCRHYLLIIYGCYNKFMLGFVSAPSAFLLYSQRNSINRLIWETEDCPDIPLPIQNLKNVRAIEFDPVNQFLYWVSF